ncbi:MAG: S1 RNA-binding domain-containing protein [Lachnospiraceae bacterium]|nr:S1 RNA-binding domain-containing protein [Lachnospiraceae bacterium]
MFRLGEMQELEIVKKVDFGVYLKDPEENSNEKVLLPVRQVPEGVDIGDRVHVFLYRDSKDRLIATTRTPLLTMGQTALLRVAQVGQYGAFLDWGLEKDLFLPFKEQTSRVREGDRCVAALYIDKSSRLCATMKVYHYLSQESPYKQEDRVQGIVYEISPEFGAFVAVDNRYSALIPKRELFDHIRVGDMVTARVTKVREDGKLTLSVREKAYLQIAVDAEKVLRVMEEYGGALPFNDKADPEVIRREMQMSKNEFKRAVGHLLKEKKVEITDAAIRRK